MPPPGRPLARALAACVAVLHLLHLGGSEPGAELHGEHHPPAYFIIREMPRLVYYGAPPAHASPSAAPPTALALELGLSIGGCVDGFRYRVSVALDSYTASGELLHEVWNHDFVGSASPQSVTASFRSPVGATHTFRAILLDMHPGLRERDVAVMDRTFSGLMSRGPVSAAPPPAPAPARNSGSLDIVLSPWSPALVSEHAGIWDAVLCGGQELGTPCNISTVSGIWRHVAVHSCNTHPRFGMLCRRDGAELSHCARSCRHRVPRPRHRNSSSLRFVAGHWPDKANTPSSCSIGGDAVFAWQ